MGNEQSGLTRGGGKHGGNQPPPRRPGAPHGVAQKIAGGASTHPKNSPQAHGKKEYNLPFADISGNNSSNMHNNNSTNANTTTTTSDPAYITTFANSRKPKAGEEGNGNKSTFVPYSMIPGLRSSNPQGGGNNDSNNAPPAQPSKANGGHGPTATSATGKSNGNGPAISPDNGYTLYSHEFGASPLLAGSGGYGFDYASPHELQEAESYSKFVKGGGKGGGDGATTAGEQRRVSDGMTTATTLLPSIVNGAKGGKLGTAGGKLVVSGGKPTVHAVPNATTNGSSVNSANSNPLPQAAAPFSVFNRGGYDLAHLEDSDFTFTSEDSEEDRREGNSNNNNNNAGGGQEGPAATPAPVPQPSDADFGEEFMEEGVPFSIFYRPTNRPSTKVPDRTTTTTTVPTTTSDALLPNTTEKARPAPLTTATGKKRQSPHANLPVFLGDGVSPMLPPSYHGSANGGAKNASGAAPASSILVSASGSKKENGRSGAAPTTTATATANKNEVNTSVVAMDDHGYGSALGSFSGWGSYGHDFVDGLQATHVNNERRSENTVNKSGNGAVGGSGGGGGGVVNSLSIHTASMVGVGSVLASRQDTEKPASPAKTNKAEEELKSATLARWTALVKPGGGGRYTSSTKKAARVGASRNNKDSNGPQDESYSQLRRANKLAPSKWNKVKEFGQKVADAHRTRIRQNRVTIDSNEVSAIHSSGTFGENNASAADYTDNTLAVFSALPMTRVKKHAAPGGEAGDGSLAGHQAPHSDEDGDTPSVPDEVRDSDGNVLLPLTMSMMWDDNVSDSDSLANAESDNSFSPEEQLPSSGDWAGDVAPTAFRRRPTGEDKKESNETSVVSAVPDRDEAMALPNVGPQPTPPHGGRHQQQGKPLWQNQWAMGGGAGAGSNAASQHPVVGDAFNNRLRPTPPPHGVGNKWQYQRQQQRQQYEMQSAPPGGFSGLNNSNSLSTSHALAQTTIIVLGPGANDAYQAHPQYRKNMALKRKMPNSNVLVPQPNIYGPPLRAMPRPNVAQAFDYTLNDVPWVRSPKWQSLKVADRMAANGHGAVGGGCPPRW